MVSFYRSNPSYATTPHYDGIHPVKAAVTSDLMVASHSDHLEKVFDTERSEGKHLDLGSAIDPNYAIFGLHADGEIMKPFDSFARLGGDPVDGLEST